LSFIFTQSPPRDGMSRLYISHKARLLSLLLFLPLVAMSLSANSAQRDHQITIDDFFGLSTLTQSQLSPDGKQAVWVESRWDKALDRTQTELWHIDTNSRKTTRLTFTDENESNPAWSPDSRYVYFIAKIGEKDPKHPYQGIAQIYRIAATGGQPQMITKSITGINAFELNKSGDSIYFSTNKEVTDKDHFASLRADHNKVNYAQGKKTTNPIYRLNLQHFSQELLLDDDKVVWQFSVNDNETKIARITTTDNELIFLEGRSNIEVFDIKQANNILLADDKWREKAPSAYGWLLGLDWHHDNQRLAFRIDFDGFPGQLFVANTAAKQAVINRVTPPSQVTFFGDDLLWRGNSNDICYRGAYKARVKLYCTEMKAMTQGKSRTVIEGDLVIGNYSFTASGKQVGVSHDGLDHVSDLFIADADSPRAQLKRLTNINPQIDSWKLPQISIVKWQATDGTQVEGILELPFGYNKAQGKLPLVVQLHGGPTAATPYALQHRSYGRSTFSAQGWALFSPNYRGSIGYGDKFITDLIGREHDIEVQDILSGVDKLISDGLVDADKLAVMGWSNGGYLTNALISSSDRFKAASSGAGVFDQRLEWMLEDTPGHVINFMQGLPWEQAEAYTKASSLTHANKITTPTLIHIGENDERVPLGHAQGLYRALNHYLNVPVELIVYPGEGHGLNKYQHRKTKMEWDRRWFDYYVLGKD
jgi:dipeptidyl aminopeptidase/acylaminoacyl peptidase